MQARQSSVQQAAPDGRETGPSQERICRMLILIAYLVLLAVLPVASILQGLIRSAYTMVILLLHISCICQYINLKAL